MAVATARADSPAGRSFFVGLSAKHPYPNRSATVSEPTSRSESESREWCVCGHSAYWHSGGGKGDCEAARECHCREYRVEVSPLQVAVADLVETAQALVDDYDGYPEQRDNNVALLEACLAALAAVSPSGAQQ